MRKKWPTNGRNSSSSSSSSISASTSENVQHLIDDLVTVGMDDAICRNATSVAALVFILF